MIAKRTAIENVTEIVLRRHRRRLISVRIMAGKYLHVMAATLNQSKHAAAPT